ncbi:MAG: sugar nucleotide-binding protein [Chitinivibrionales bacterium]|nr:sugar nucleotide-binding protein [Chitinivibrionales bacterium]
MNPRVLLTGITSIHGWPIFRAFERMLPAASLFGIRPPKMDIPAQPNVFSVCISDKSELQRIRDDFNPTHVLHSAGVCDLDVCEERPHWARMINIGGADAIADVFGDSCYILYLSTDLVFSGDCPPPAGYTEEHNPDPLSIAGQTFVQAEKRIARCPRHCIVRLGLPLGNSITGAKGAVDWIESRFKKGLPVTLFHDEYRSCISCEEIGAMSWSVFEKEVTGLYHFGGLQPQSLHELGKCVLIRGPYDPKLLNGISRFEEVDGPPRIGNVAMDSSKLRGILNR